MAKIAMTDLAVKALQPPPKGQKTYWSKDLAGFGIRVSQGGAKTFVVLDPRSKIRIQQTVGRYPLIDLKTARSAAKRLLAEAVLGRTQTQSVGWNTALETYLTELKEKRKPRTYADYARLLKKHFRFGETKLSDITPAMIDGKLSKLSATPAEQQHAFVVIRAFVKWGYRKSYIDRNPMDRMEEPKGYEARDKVLNDDELKKVWNALEDSTFGRIVKLLITTGQRETEIAYLTPDMIKGDQITLPSWLTKNKREHTFPIGKLSASLLHYDVGCKFVHPARGSPEKPFNGWSKCKAALDKRSGVSGWRLHDLRRTFRTKWEELGIQPTVAERYINHISGSHAGISRVYNRHKYLSEMRQAVEVYETWLQTLLAPEVKPRGSRASQQWETRDAALIEEASA
ncbi:MAG: integrase arm-type DNA-binding domain-containing protein [Alphaproteobacteria bacterium]|uniref:tyrosine-type recombinase/integrase n=1 Tax=Bradyrhizobium sp. TaxID=376 RepID=UPI001EBEAEBC|nr:integrase arm-type DNA-binding domain-containing protein [Bradyrhizobium sp.]MBV9570752.1 integrase arm-type DNA-binding domain-containing protein [Alphaproteobacteria bacterium]MBV9979003.1 integrase arm-type DNA-binding domain-containing protein [Bradyrhizobium sp.]